MWVTIVLFLGGILFSLINVFSVTTDGDHAADMKQAIATVCVVNSVLILVLAGTAYFYTQQNPTATQPYVMTMLHLTLLLSIISVSVSSLFSIA